MGFHTPSDRHFNDVLEPLDSAEIIGRYTEGYYAKTGALIRNRFGKGSVYYFGGAFTEEAVKVFLDKLSVISPYASYVDLPDCCEVAMRTNGKEHYLFLLNYTAEEQCFDLKHAMTNLDSGVNETGKQALEPYGTRVYKLDC